MSEKEEQAHFLIANLELDLDSENARGKAIDLFRTTLTKAIFSSPAACLETVLGRIKRIENGVARGTEEDRQKLFTLSELLASIDTEEFTKYQNLLSLLREILWTGKDQRDRLVIFSERIRTLEWLEERLKTDLNLKHGMIGRVDGGSIEAEVKTQKVLEDFGQEKSPLRILLASDMASEGLNLHFQSHRLIHFDLPWSLLRFQQRNGRIDRYGQDRPPHIYYFVGESRHPKVRALWVLEKLVEKDIAAQKGIGDPAVFLGVGDADLEEEVVALAVNAGVGADAFEAEMDSHLEEARRAKSVGDELDALFGDYTGVDHSSAPGEATIVQDETPPRLFPDTFTYSRSMLQRLAEPSEGIFETPPDIDLDDRLIRFRIPKDMMSDGGFGYAHSDQVDDRYMPVEAIGNGGLVELTDQIEVIDAAIEQAKTQERSWPTVQYLWDGHPIFGWFGERAEIFFPERSAPLCSLRGRLNTGEVAVLLHGAIPNAVGAPVVDRWAVVTLKGGQVLKIETVGDFVARVGLAGKTPNNDAPDPALAGSVLGQAVNAFQSYLIEHRRMRAADIEESLVQLWIVWRDSRRASACSSV